GRAPGRTRADRPLGREVSGGLAGSGARGAGDALDRGRELPGIAMTRAAIVTGGGTGIGRATALALHRDGFAVAIAGRRPEPLEEARQLIGDDCAVLAGDIRKPEVADELIATALSRFGRIDALVNDAGGQCVAAAAEITPQG